MLYNTFLYDGTFEGLLTTIFYCYTIKDDITIKSSINFTVDLISVPKEIATEEDKFNRVYSSIRDKLSYQTLRNIYYLFLSDIDGFENLTLKYLKLCYRYGDSINQAKNNDIISLVDKYCRRVSLEAHRFTGFVRFQKIDNNFYYSSIEPDHNVLPIISNHFTKRFSDQNFIIHDLKRNLALFFNQSDYIITELSENEAKDLLLNNNDDIKDLWKVFYKSVNIKERKNLKLQKRQMPKRYWKHLTEIQ